MYFPSLSGTPGVPGSNINPLPLTASKKDSHKNEDDITGKFDPTALERGAKALKELDGSTNAGKAFEVIKLQETTKQRELQRDIEELARARTQASTERSRVENEEKRKTINHQQEQERVTAQYRAKLEGEAYQKKLQDQQKQNEEWLRQQHQQFLRQEEARKKTEAEMLDMRRKQLREEKALEIEAMQKRVREETKGRIQQERENIDIHLRSMRAKSAENRKTRLDSINSIFSGIGGGFNSLVEDRTRLLTLIGGITAIAGGIYGSRTGMHLLGRYAESRMGKPPLIRETSRWTFARNFKSLNPFAAKKSPKDFQDKIVLESELSERLRWTTNSLITAKSNRTPFRHMCLYGPPGTGKTLFARTLARESGMDYAIMAGGDVGPLGKEAVTEINKVFKWANHSKKGLILFIDEADAFLRQGRGQMHGLSEDLRNALSAFLYHTGTESDKFCAILATNCREIFDRAVLDRIDEHFAFPLPGKQERHRMIQMYMEKYVFSAAKAKQFKVDPEIDETFLEEMANKTEKFSGRQIAKLCISMQAAMYGSGTGALTKGLAETVLRWQIAHFEEDIDTIDRSS
ncbi:ATPase, AAA family protein [Cardiosporidium cionae]|uniref:ATPase, AAA family protein n=1 Tax=Cardiosporidium cionae TaxID=476202 RepID=A0ABQ7JE64_9APIC|nr:ATPase, AAA family protein [Cardiosporidium cionae]|eukprot:KAF8822266.1 ATPase, AAA family protein [Cardiosporidium cionae]